MTTHESSTRRRVTAVAGSGAILAAGAGAFIATAPTAGATSTFTVTSLADTNTAGTLRNAIDNANTTAGHDIIVFDSGLSGTITMTSDFPVIYQDVDITGNGAVTIDGGWRSGVTAGYSVFKFVGVSGSVDISDVIITGGNATSYGGTISFYNSAGDITVSNSTLTANHGHEGGAIVVYHQVSGSLTVSATTISGNSADGGSAGIHVEGTVGDFPITITDSTFDSNDATGGEGGALYSDNGDSGLARTTITNSTFTNNSSGTEGGAIHLAYGNITISDSLFSGNHTDSSGGALYFDTGDNYIVNSVFTDNTADSGGGAILTSGNLTITASAFDGNEGGPSYGGGAIVQYAGDLVVEDSEFTNNNAVAGGGAITNSGDSAVIRNSTFSGNTAGGNGGALYNDGASLTVENSTIANNESSAAGGAIFGSMYGLVLISDTITGNTASEIGGVALNPAAPGPNDLTPTTGQTDIVSTILVGNGTMDLAAIGGDPAAAVVETDHSLIGVTPIAFTDHGGTTTGVTVSQLALGPLADNGGLTNTFALLQGSVAIDAGPTTLPPFSGDQFDQRGAGFARSINGTIDVGAYEVQVPYPPAPDPVVPSFTG